MSKREFDENDSRGYVGSDDSHAKHELVRLARNVQALNGVVQRLEVELAVLKAKVMLAGGIVSLGVTGFIEWLLHRI